MQLKIALLGFRELHAIGTFLTVYEALNVSKFIVGIRADQVEKVHQNRRPVDQICVKVSRGNEDYKDSILAKSSLLPNIWYIYLYSYLFNGFMLGIWCV